MTDATRLRSATSPTRAAEARHATSTPVLPRELRADEEAARLAAVRRYDVLDSPPDGAFDRITALAARLLDVPISVVSIVDTDRIWFKSHHGLDAEEIGRDPGLCASAILQDGPWLVSDAATDPRTLANPLVAGELGLRFYAGVPLTTHDGHNLGTLCVIDTEPRDIEPVQVDTLRDLASVVMDELELRLSTRRTVALESEMRRSAEDVARTLQESLLPPELPRVPGLELAARYHVADRAQVGGDFYDVVVGARDTALVVGDACGRGTDAAALTGTARWTLRTITSQPWTPAAALARLNSVLAATKERPDQYCTVAVAAVRRREDGVDLTVALGGHPHPLVVRRDGDVLRVGTTSPIVGWRPDVTYREETTVLHRDDVLVLFTDGLIGRSPDATDDTSVRAALAPLAGASAEAVADALDRAVESRPLSDDAAFLVVGVR